MNKRTTLTQIAGVVGAALFSSAIALAPQTAEAKDKVVLMLNWYLYAEHAPFFLGRANGYFDAQGIELTIQEGRGSGGTVQAVASKTVDFGYADIPTMIKISAKGAPVKSVGVALQTSPMSVISFSDKNIRKPADIKGKIVAVTPGDSMSQIWPFFLEKTGLKKGDFKTVAGDGKTKLNAVIVGQADVLLGYLMDQTMKITDATGKKTHAIRFADHGVNLVSSGLIANKATIADNPDLVKRFMAAATQSFEAAVKNPEGAVDAMLKARPKAGKRATLLNGLMLTTPLYSTPATVSKRPFDVDASNLENSLSLLVKFGGVKKSAMGPVSDYYTSEFLPK